MTDGAAPADLAAWVASELSTPAALHPLRAEASTRSFYRVVCETPVPGGLVAMRSPPQTEDNGRFLRLAALFRRYGLNTPTVHASDLGRGFLLVEDLGERDFEAAYAAGEVEGPLAAAIEALHALQRIPDEPASGIPPYTPERFADELAIFADWLARRFLALAVPGFFSAVCDALVEATQSVPQRVAHRDYHCRNLIWRAGGRVGIVDFQDALVGPATYDIASLLRDCYHEFDEPVVAHWRRRFFEGAGLGVDEAAFNRVFDFTAMQRQLKAAGIFARLYLQRGQRSHLTHVAPVLRRIVRAGGGYRETAELADWIERAVLPSAERRLAGRDSGP